MKILIDIGHPAHVLLFKNIARLLKKNGHDVLFTAREKDVTIDLLNFNNLDYISFGKPYPNIILKIYGLFVFTIKLIKISKKYKPDIFISHLSIYSLFVSVLYKKPNIILHAVERDFFIPIFKHFASLILTSNSFEKNLGKKHIKYPGFHEIAYLHPKYFNDYFTDEDIGFDFTEKPLIFLRFVNWNAYDDIGLKGLSFYQKHKVVKTFEKYGKVYISSESDLPYILQKYKLQIKPFQLQYFESKIDFFFGESGSMAAECSILGIPSIYISNKTHGFIKDLASSYNNISHFKINKFDEALEKSIYILNNYQRENELSKNRAKLIFDNSIDLNEYLIWVIEKYPASIRFLKENPDHAYNFR